MWEKFSLLSVAEVGFVVMRMVVVPKAIVILLRTIRIAGAHLHVIPILVIVVNLGMEGGIRGVIVMQTGRGASKIGRVRIRRQAAVGQIVLEIIGPVVQQQRWGAVIRVAQGIVVIILPLGMGHWPVVVIADRSPVRVWNV